MDNRSTTSVYRQITKPIKARTQGELVPRDNIIQLMKMLDARLAPDQEVISFLQDLVEEYVIESAEEMMVYARHRSDNTLDFRDAKLYYERQFHHSIPAILSVIQQSHLPTESILKSIYKKKPLTKNHITHIQDFKKAKK
ncbi:hypothetical protein EDI_322430 [Entamoeba dispar SAW760]|uniref:Transcription initiation factor TFIID subunit 12 domain-containing protein n=1 Tax=Entamoeba dispar (strain ATCC PRA-260 / SAW760) TaxID=370354 RepID=B0E5S5_ENTDS|nr:uncharacterized protein EDI_322430 [Entamoeba dispar SAW760]XP_001735702.1 uncharacterized protein EDI_025860 [Entamoeba dispar SAW760]EDR28115.1 hypothetical protein EDI_025860 [Entamoeba dispar SAW760]EDR30111.1 hypothetical protein EDI_322430 [Entamoeba dispar SAW760]|eukprot:EDR28115.1 hypothetical protein EDI_025860 [Entamoeba dispar SAW760]